ncbi:MAG: energy-coupling factor transporter ATPase [Solobacterium sp.]|nr:energy-coupling factor transporter ATPase [Solobacterium sp.]
MSITFSKVSYVYSPGTPYEYRALDGVDLTLEEGKITAVIGRTGSGKSTLIQHLNALLLPNEGEIQILGRTIKAGEKPKNLKPLRKDVGLVFQFPEYQLFEETVIKDVIFGPKNFGVSEEDAKKKAKEALALVGLSEDIYEKSPLELSGGQKRRVAIADILAMDPKILVLDEPTAGLDPMGTKEMMSLFYRLNRQFGKTILIVTHDMEQVYQYCDDVVVLEDGKVRIHQDKDTFFRDAKECESMGILPPALIRMKEILKAKGFTLSENIHSVDALAEALREEVRNG